MKNVPTYRAPLERFRVIKRAFERGQENTTATLAERLEVSRKTVQRDIDFLRDRLGLVCEYDHETRTWTAPEGQVLL